MKRAKFWMQLLVLLSIAVGWPLKARTAEAIVDGVSLSYSVSDGQASVNHATVPTDTSVVIAIPATLGGYPVTSVQPFAFGECDNLTSVTLPDSVTRIGKYAFTSCSSLTNMTLGSGLTWIGISAFSSCSGLTSVSIPDSVVGIEYGAFSGCSSLTNVVLPDSVTSIEERIFSGCANLTSVVIGKSVTNIGEYAFSDCSSLTNVEIPNSVTRIGEKAFMYCDGLTSITIPDSVMIIGASAFTYCHGLTTLFAPASWESKYIEGKFWSNYAGVQSECKVVYSPLELAASELDFSALAATNQQLEVTANVSWKAESSVSWLMVKTASGSGSGMIVYELAANTEMDARTATITVTGGGLARTFTVTQHSAQEPIEWQYTVSNGQVSLGTGSWEITAVPTWTLGDIIIPSTLGGYPVTSIGDCAFEDCSGLTSVVIPSGVTNIASHAFRNCSALTNITIPEGVTRIVGYAFQECSGLTNLVIPNSVKKIGRAAFIGCSGLTSVTIGNNVTNIDDFAFMCCNGLTSVTIPASVVSIGVGAFSGPMFSVAVGNPAYKEESGLLLTKDGKTLLCGANGDVVIPGGVTSIEDYAFQWCLGLTSVTIPNSVTNIGYAAFSYCRALANVTIPPGVTCIQPETFIGCNGLTNVTIPESVTSIGKFAFIACSCLTSVVIPNSVTSIGGAVFRECDTLKTLYMPVSWQGKIVVNGLTWDSYAEVPATCKIIYGEQPAITTTGVPYRWLEYNAADILAIHGGDYEAAALADAANKLPMWQCYVAGLSTTDKEAKFKVKSLSIVGGKLVVEWDPDLNEERAYKLLGKRTLSDEKWEEVSEGADVDTEGWRFFRVRVELP